MQNTKLQSPNKLQAPNPKAEKREFKLGDWNFFGIWCLEFGVLTRPNSFEEVPP
jgi:hypothetical protein